MHSKNPDKGIPTLMAKKFKGTISSINRQAEKIKDVLSQDIFAKIKKSNFSVSIDDVIDQAVKNKKKRAGILVGNFDEKAYRKSLKKSLDLVGPYKFKSNESLSAEKLWRFEIEASAKIKDPNFQKAIETIPAAQENLRAFRSAASELLKINVGLEDEFAQYGPIAEITESLSTSEAKLGKRVPLTDFEVAMGVGAMWNKTLIPVSMITMTTRRAMRNGFITSHIGSGAMKLSEMLYAVNNQPIIQNFIWDSLEEVFDKD